MERTVIRKHEYRQPTGRRITKADCTVPDQTMSVREIIGRFTRGQSVNGNAQAPQYHPDAPPIDYRNLDFTEREDLLLRNRAAFEEIKERDKQLRAERTALEKKKQEDYEAELLAKWKESQALIPS